jgi:hypothetical protein
MEARRPLNYYSGPLFLQSDLKQGVLRSRSGVRLVGISEDFLRGFVIACEHETGPATALILRRCGQLFGQRLASRCAAELGSYLGRSLPDCAMGEFDLLLQDLWRGCGLGELVVDWSRGQFGFLAVSLANSPMQNIGPQGHVADDMFCGVIEGFLNHFSSDSLSCVQTGDARLGDRGGTTFILGSPELAERVKALVERGVPHTNLVGQLSS